MIDFERLFNPRAIAIVGVRDTKSGPSGGDYFLRAFHKMGFDKPLYIFNPRMKGQQLYGVDVHGSILEIPDDKPIDYAILAVPARLCPTLLKEIGKKKVPFVTIFSSGFSEIGNAHLEEEVIRIAREYNIRIIGPNCIGVFVPKNKIAFSPVAFDESGNLGMILQSGGLAIYLTARAHSIFGTNTSKVLSIGNQIDLNFVDFLKYFVTDDETHVVGMYLENIKSQEIGREFFKTVKELTSKGKPVIIWKVGFGESTKEAILSHTGGLAGSTKIWEAVAKQTGASMVNHSDELINLAMAFKHLGEFPLNRNMGIITAGGGASIETTDVFERYNLKVPKIAQETVEKLQEVIPEVNTILRNPLDLGGSGGVPEIFYKTLVSLDSDPNIDAVIFIKVFAFSDGFLNAVKKAYKEMKKPLICISQKIVDDVEDYTNKLKFKQALYKRGVPVFESIEAAAKALDKVCTYKEFLGRKPFSK